MTENLLDSIKVISDGIFALNHRLSNMMPNETGFKELKDARNRAVDGLHFLVEKFTTNSTERFIKLDSELATVNADMKKVLDSLRDLQKTIDTVTRFVSAIDALINSINKVV